eukprot:TRINITY_DN3577_c0_g1_i14.p2 TRINITY_DN3577_c0_g1~~TRINITY_DN3577_c0_g1_i14.p2  ORF type:complete len:202 (-),score=-11.49 TRINITY_DN3577_c0_g1_i14:35-640(-)
MSKIFVLFEQKLDQVKAQQATYDNRKKTPVVLELPDTCQNIQQLKFSIILQKQLLVKYFCVFYVILSFSKNKRSERLHNNPSFYSVLIVYFYKAIDRLKSQLALCLVVIVRYDLELSINFKVGCSCWLHMVISRFQVQVGSPLFQLYVIFCFIFCRIFYVVYDQCCQACQLDLGYSQTYRQKYSVAILIIVSGHVDLKYQT